MNTRSIAHPDPLESESPFLLNGKRLTMTTNTPNPPAEGDPEELLSVRQVAAILNVTEDWVRKLIRRDKKLKGTLVDAFYVVRRADLENYIREYVDNDTSTNT